MTIAMIEGDDRPSTSDEGERPSMVVPAPLAACGHPRPFCRDLCRSCYRKLGEADALPPPLDPGRKRSHPLRRWLGTLSPALLIQMKAWIAEIERMAK